MKLRARLKERGPVKNTVHIEVRKKSGELVRQQLTNLVTNRGQYFATGWDGQSVDAVRGFTVIWLGNGANEITPSTVEIADTGSTAGVKSSQQTRRNTRYEVIEGESYFVWDMEVEFFSRISSVGGFTARQVGLATYLSEIGSFTNIAVTAGTLLDDEIDLEPGDSCRVKYTVYFPVPDDAVAAQNEPVSSGTVNVIRKDLDDQIIDSEVVGYSIIRRRLGTDSDIWKLHTIRNTSYSNAFIKVAGAWVSAVATTSTTITKHPTSANKYSDKRVDISSEIVLRRSGEEGTELLIEGMRLFSDATVTSISSANRSLIEIIFDTPIVKSWTDSLKLNFEMEVTW